MSDIPPWGNGPFELLVHAEGHLRKGEDFDRRIALISYDNAIEVAISTYLSLHPIQRGGRTYAKSDIEIWQENYHTKLDFLDQELQSRGIAWYVERAHIIWAHDHRNEQYHGRNMGTPEKRVLAIIRAAALWVFSTLYDVKDPETVLEREIAALSGPPSPQRDGKYDRAIDRVYEIIEIAGERYYVSEVLFAVDHAAYLHIGAKLCNPVSHADSEKEAE